MLRHMCMRKEGQQFDPVAPRSAPQAAGMGGCLTLRARSTGTRVCSTIRRAIRHKEYQNMKLPKSLKAPHEKLAAE